jgi:hypothetical protein
MSPSLEYKSAQKEKYFSPHLENSLLYGNTYNKILDIKSLISRPIVISKQTRIEIYKALTRSSPHSQHRIVEDWYKPEIFYNMAGRLRYFWSENKGKQF